MSARIPAVLALVAASCVASHLLPEEGPRGVIVTQIPAGQDWNGTGDPLSLTPPYPPGSRIVWISPGGGGTPRVLSRGLAAAGAPALSPDGEHLLFAGRHLPSSRWEIFEVSLHGSRPRAVAQPQGDCLDPGYLAGGRLIMTCSSDAGRTWSLHTTALDGVKRITFGPGSAFDPVPLQDGRILFSMWLGRGPGRPDGGVALFTINPDGTLLVAFAGAHRPPPIKFRARPTFDGHVLVLVAERDGSRRRAERLDLRRPTSTGTVLPLSLEIESAGSPAVTLEPTSIEPYPDGTLLTAARPHSAGGSVGGTWGIYNVGEDGQALELVFDDPEWDEIEAVPVFSRSAPRGRPSAVAAESSVGTLICYDVNRSDASVGPSAHDARAMTVSVQTLSGTRTKTVGNVTLESDGSFFVEVPADIPLRVVSRDGEGRDLSTSAWFWVRPGEVRACFGCHESRETAPANRQVKALKYPPHRLGMSPKRGSP